MKALKMGLGIAVGTFVVFTIDEGGVTPDGAIRSLATGVLSAALLALVYAYQARRGRGRV